MNKGKELAKKKKEEEGERGKICSRAKARTCDRSMLVRLCPTVRPCPRDKRNCNSYSFKLRPNWCLPGTCPHSPLSTFAYSFFPPFLLSFYSSLFVLFLSFFLSFRFFLHFCPPFSTWMSVVSPLSLRSFLLPLFSLSLSKHDRNLRLTWITATQIKDKLQQAVNHLSSSSAQLIKRKQITS